MPKFQIHTSKWNQNCNYYVPGAGLGSNFLHWVTFWINYNVLGNIILKSLQHGNQGRYDICHHNPYNVIGQVTEQSWWKLNKG